MKNIEFLKQFGVKSLEDARELGELTDRIVANLKTIAENDNELDGLFQQTSNIVANLKFIEESNVNLNEMVEQSNAVVTNLRGIEEQA